MRMISLRPTLGLLLLGLLLSATGCRSTGGWWSTPSWMKGGGAGNDSTGQSLAITKPSTQAPKPEGAPTQPNTGIAATNPAGNTGVSTASATGTGNPQYPLTAQAGNYPDQPASSWQPGGQTQGEIAPAGGYNQVGPYSMGGPGTPAPTAPAEGNSQEYPAQQPAESYQPNGWGSGASNSTNPTAEAPQSEIANAGYAPESSQDVPAEESSAYGGSAASDEGAYGAQPAAPDNYNYGPVNTVKPATPAAPQPASRSTLPSSLSSSGGYRPGSTSAPGSRTASSGVQNARYDQPGSTAPASGTGFSSGGTSWR